MISDDVASLIAANSAHGQRGQVEFHSGYLAAFDRFNGRNQVLVAGEPLTDLPVLASGATVALSAGDTVGVLRIRSQMWILGRIRTPTPLVTPTATEIGIPATPSNGEQNFALTTTPTARAINTQHVVAPSWASGMSYAVRADLVVRNTTAGTRTVDLQAVIAGGAGAPIRQSVPAGTYGSLSAGVAGTRAVEPGDVVQVHALVSADAAIPADPWTGAYITGHVTFY